MNLPLDPAFHDVRIPGPVQDAGHAYGRRCSDAGLFEPARLDAYLAALSALNRTDPDHLARCADRWAARLPDHHQLQIDAMAAGGGLPAPRLRQWLYADIAAPLPAAPADAPAPAPDAPADLINAAGPLCSGLAVFHDGDPWVGRNCDWYRQTLSRGTAAVRHAVPGRIPCAAVGLMGDVDADTGLNAAGLWLHMHTLLARDEPRPGVSCISWLFWMREALETCETFDDLERFIAATDRDRGVILLAAHGPSRSAALFECSRAAFARHDPWPGHAGPHPRLAVTNHPRHKHPPPGAPRSGRPGSTITRCDRLAHLADHAHPERLPDDLAEILADPLVEMGDSALSPDLRTIYSAVADPARLRLWFASGDCPAASRAPWREIHL